MGMTTLRTADGRSTNSKICPSANPRWTVFSDKPAALEINGVVNADATDTTAPGLDTATPPFLYTRSGEEVVALTYDGDLDSGSTPNPSAFSFTVDGKRRTVSRVDVGHTTVRLRLPIRVESGKTVKVRYTVPTTNPLQDANGNAAAALVNRAVTNNSRFVNSPATGGPTISGTAYVGETLTVSTRDIRDPDGLDGVSYGYQWIRVDGTTQTNISGATSRTYTPVAADEGKKVKVKVSFTDEAGISETRTGSPTNVVIGSADATGVPTISGMAQVGHVLTASVTGITDPDELNDVRYSYQWIRVDGGDESEIARAWSATYTPVAADEGKKVKVAVNFTDDSGTPEALTSAPYPSSATIASGVNSAATGMPDVSGETRLGGVLVASTRNIADANGLTRAQAGDSGFAYRYQWIRVDGGNGSEISGATSRSYDVTSHDVGKTLKVKVSFSDDHGHAEERTSIAKPASGSIAGSERRLPGSTHDHVNYWDREYAEGKVTHLVYRVYVPYASQRFTIGSNVSAYQFEGVAILLDLIDKRGGGVKVGLYSDKDGVAFRRLAWLNPVGPLRDGRMNFRAVRRMGEYPLLEPNTAYHILFVSHGAGAYLDMPPEAIDNSRYLTDGVRLDNGSLSFILPSLYNEGYQHLPSSQGEYGEDETRTLGLNQAPTQTGFDVTYGWNKFSRQLRVTIVGSAVSGGAPVFNLAPRFLKAQVATAGTTLDVLFDNVPDEHAQRTPPRSLFTVTADGREVGVTTVAVSGVNKRARLTLDRVIYPGQSVRVGYRDPTSGDDTAALQAPAGRDTPGFTDKWVANRSTAPDPRPKPASATVPAAGTTLDIVLNVVPDDRAQRTPPPALFTVTADGREVPVSSVAVSGTDKRVRLTLSATVAENQKVTVSYLDPTVRDDTAALQTPTGEDAPSFADYPVTNNSTVPNPAPVPQSATLPQSGDMLDIVFNVALHDGAGRAPAPSAFTVNGDDEAFTVTQVEITSAEKRVRLTLGSAIHGEATVTVSYEDPTAEDDTAALQSADGKDAASFTDFAVTNSSTVPHPDTGPPKVKDAWFTNFGGYLWLRFERAVDRDNLPPTSAFHVTAFGQSWNVYSVRQPSGFMGLVDLGADHIVLDTGDIGFGEQENAMVTYSDPTDEDDVNAIQSIRGVDADDFTTSVRPSTQGRSASAPEPLTASFSDLPARHNGAAFTFALAFSAQVAVQAKTLREHAFTVIGGSVTAAEKIDAESSRNWRITVTPSSATSAVTVALVAKKSCEAKGAVCTSAGHGLAEPEVAEVPGRAPTQVVSATVTSEPGENGAWDTDETVVVEVRFSRSVGCTDRRTSSPPSESPSTAPVATRDTCAEAARRRCASNTP